MTQHALASRTPVEGGRQSAELAAVGRMLHAARGSFTFAVAVCNSPALRDYLIEQLQQSFPRIAVVNIPVGTVDIYGFVTAQELVHDPGAVFLVGLESSMRIAESADPKPSREPTAETRHLLRSFNASRDLWPARLACPLVAWLPEYAAMLFASHAHDLWRFISHRFEFVSEQTTAVGGVSDRFAGDLMVASNLSAEEKHFRIAELEQRLTDAGPQPAKSLLPHVSVWLSELGFIYKSLGDLDRAEEMHKKSLAINEKLGLQEGMAVEYGNLGLIYRSVGDLDRAEEMHKKSLAIEEKLDSQEGMANQYGNLGLIYLTRGDLDRAEEMLTKALTMQETLGLQEYMANQYGNLGLIYRTRGELDRAEEMVKKSLAINEKLGRQVGMAAAYGNLGLIYRTRGELDRAEVMHKKSLAIDEKLGHQEGMARHYGNLGLIYKRRGELDRAEEMLTKALTIQEKLGLQEYMANQYANLGGVAEDRGDVDRARELWTKSRDLYAKIGMSLDVKEVQGWLDGLPGPVAK